MVKNKSIEQIIEVKYADQTISKSLHIFHQKYNFPAIQIVHQLRYDRVVDTIKVVRAERFLQDLLM